MPDSPLARAIVVAMAIALPLAGCGSTPPIAPPVPTLTVSSVTPQSGSIAGGTTITITGTLFASDATVTIDGTPATAVTVSGSTSLTAVTPKHAAGLAALIVTSGGASASAPAGFTYLAPSGGNLPPVISNIRSTGSRPGQPSGFADIGEAITLLATVTDAETAASALTFAWSVPQGSVTGTSATAIWMLPATLATTPATITATLTVTEPYTENGVAQTNVSTRTFAVSVHNSQKEILDMGQEFLELFSVDDNAPEDVVRNFSRTCDGGAGYEDELSDVQDVRYYYHELPGWDVKKVPPVTFNFSGRCDFRNRNADACARFAVHWYDELRVTDPEDPTRPVGSQGETQGIDYVTAVLENNQWRLCHSDYQADEEPAFLTGFAKFLFRKHGGGKGLPIPKAAIR